MSTRKPVRTVTVASGKGGVGKTNLVANLAVALGSMGRDVLVVDADVGVSNVDVLLHLAPPYNVSHVLSGEKRLEEVLVEGPHGIRILPAAFGAPELTRLDAGQRLRLLDAVDACDPGIDVVLVDAPAGISENVAFFCAASQETIVVTAPEPTAVTGACALIKMLSTRYGEKRFAVLVNFARTEAEAVDAYRALSSVAGMLLNVSLDYLGCVPRDDAVPDAVRSQAPFVDMFPDRPASRKLREIAARLLERPAGGAKGSLQFFIESLCSSAAGV